MCPAGCCGPTARKAAALSGFLIRPPPEPSSRNRSGRSGKSPGAGDSPAAKRSHGDLKAARGPWNDIRLRPPSPSADSCRETYYTPSAAVPGPRGARAPQCRGPVSSVARALESYWRSPTLGPRLLRPARSGLIQTSVPARRSLPVVPAEQSPRRTATSLSSRATGRPRQHEPPRTLAPP